MNKVGIFLAILAFFLTSNCGIYKKTDSRETPTNALERARKNVQEGRGISIGNALKRGSTTYEFNTSNPLWRASLEIIDFVPLTTVDYAGGVIISDWYSDSTEPNNAIKITIRFLTNEIRSDSLKIIIHQKICSKNFNNCNIKPIESKIKTELVEAIMKKALFFDQELKNKKK